MLESVPRSDVSIELPSDFEPMCAVLKAEITKQSPGKGRYWRLRDVRFRDEMAIGPGVRRSLLALFSFGVMDTLTADTNTADKLFCTPSKDSQFIVPCFHPELTAEQEDMYFLIGQVGNLFIYLFIYLFINLKK